MVAFLWELLSAPRGGRCGRGDGDVAVGDWRYRGGGGCRGRSDDGLHSLVACPGPEVQALAGEIEFPELYRLGGGGYEIALVNHPTLPVGGETGLAVAAASSLQPRDTDGARAAAVADEQCCCSIRSDEILRPLEGRTIGRHEFRKRHTFRRHARTVSDRLGTAYEGEAEHDGSEQVANHDRPPVAVERKKPVTNIGSDFVLWASWTNPGVPHAAKRLGRVAEKPRKVNIWVAKNAPDCSNAFLLVLFLGCGNDFTKDCWVLFGNLRKDFSIYGNVRKLEHVDETGVRKTEFVNCGVYLYRPKCSECAFFCTAVAECVNASLEHSRASKTNLALTAPLEAFYAGEQVLSAFCMLGTSFYSWHIGFR